MSEPRDQTSLARRLFFWAVLFASVILVLEAVSWLALSILEQRPIGYGWIRSEQRERARDSVPQNLRRARRRGEQTVEAVHPYLGYVSATAGDLGFPLEGPPKRAPGRLVLGISGGSVARGLVGPAMEPALDRLARATGKDVELASLALDGFKQPQQLMALEYMLVMGAEFDVFVNLDGFNEIALHYSANGPKGVHPVYPQNWYNRAEAGLPDAAMTYFVGALQYHRGVRKSWAKELMRPSWRWSMTAALVWRARDRYLGGLIYEADTALREYVPPERAYQLTGPRFDASDDAEVAAELVRIWYESSLQLHRMAEANDIAYFHFLQPNQYVPGSKPLSDTERLDAYDADHPHRFAVIEGYPRLEEAGAELARQGVRFHDLSQVFAGVEEDIYVDDCCHFGRRGYDLVWDAIVDALLEDPAWGAHATPDVAGDASGP